MNGKMRAIANRLSQLGLTVRGADGEGSAADGALYQISNQATLGLTEEQTVEKLSNVVSQIIENERELRRKMSERDGDHIRDVSRRALGTALYAERMDTDELTKLYANIRLGVAMGCITETDYVTLDALRIEAQRAALTERFSLDANDSEKRDKVRAKFVRETLSKKD
jgi:protein arginine kinase